MRSFIQVHLYYIITLHLNYLSMVVRLSYLLSYCLIDFDLFVWKGLIYPMERIMLR